MHDLDRTMFETTAMEHESELPDNREQQEFLEVLGGLLRESGEQTETYEGYEVDGRELVERTSNEAALAGELLEAHEAGELDRFLGSLLNRAAGAVKNFARSDTGRALGGILKKAAGEALPVIGRGIGGAINPKYAGFGERAGKAAGTLFGLELESLSNEDREFEAAKAFVRFAQEAAKRAAKLNDCGPPQAVATAAATAAAQRHAPGLLTVAKPGGAAVLKPLGQSRGEWVRRGDRIVILGV